MQDSVISYANGFVQLVKNALQYPAEFAVVTGWRSLQA
jgi:hypothetical protein